MIGGLKRTTSRIAVAAAAGLFMGGLAVSPAQAADLGGDCCADLEERVAELEATTVRKGNRKVSVKLSGQVNRALLWWDDGDEHDLYSVDNAASNTRIRLTGSAKIRPGWSAGFYIEWSLVSNSSSATDQPFDPHDQGGGLSLRHAVWWMKWDKLGQVWVGQHSAATDNLIYIGSQSVARGAHDQALVGGGFFLTRSGISGNPGHIISGETWGTYLPSFDVANRHDLVRYDSPDILGCVVSASWGENDIWDVAARCKKELNSVKVLFGIGYIERTVTEDWVEVANPFGPGLTQQSVDRAGGPNDFIVVGAISHDPSGLYIHGVYAHREFDSPHTSSITPGPVTGRLTPGDVDSFYLQAGIYRRWNDLGKTAIYIDWRHAEDGNVGASGANFLAASEITSSEADAYGFGIVQNIDAAAMEVYLDYKHAEADVTVCTGAAGACTAFFDEAIDDFDSVIFGARIKF